MKLFHGSLLRFQLFLPASCGGWVIVAAGLIGIDVLIQKRLGQGLADTEYLYPVTLMLPQGRQRLCGYLDSGNSAVFEGLPLVFVRPSLCRQLQNHPRPLAVHSDRSGLSASGCVADEADHSGAVWARGLAGRQ